MLGKKLTIDNETYADLNEIVARFIEPVCRRRSVVQRRPTTERRQMNVLCRAVLRHDKYTPASHIEVANRLLAEKVRRRRRRRRRRT